MLLLPSIILYSSIVYSMSFPAILLLHYLCILFCNSSYSCFFLALCYLNCLLFSIICVVSCVNFLLQLDIFSCTATWTVLHKDIDMHYSLSFEHMFSCFSDIPCSWSMSLQLFVIFTLSAITMIFTLVLISLWSLLVVNLFSINTLSIVLFLLDIMKSIPYCSV